MESGAGRSRLVALRSPPNDSILFLMLAAHCFPLSAKHLGPICQEHFPCASETVAFEIGLHAHDSFGFLLPGFHDERAVLLAELDVELKKEPIVGKRYLGEEVAAVLPTTLIGDVLIVLGEGIAGEPISLLLEVNFALALPHAVL